MSATSIMSAGACCCTMTNLLLFMEGRVLADGAQGLLVFHSQVLV